MPNDADLVYERALKTLPVIGARLPVDYYYASAPLCVIDAVWSIGVNYQGVKKVVERYCERTGLPKLYDMETLPRPEEQESVSAFCARLEQLGPDLAADELFGNRQRTSTQNGILKSTAVYRFATALRDHGVEHLQDVPRGMSDTDLEKAIHDVPGQSSGISLAYFWMLAGSGDHIKPDRMVERFLEESLGRKVMKGEALHLLTLVSADLEGYHPHMTPRLLDHLIWRWQREEPANRRRALDLVALLPKLEAEGFAPYKIEGGEKSMIEGQKVPHVPYPIYHPTLMKVFKLVDGVDPYASLPEDPSGVKPIDIVLGEEDIRSATRNGTLRYLAICMRREKFCGGYIAGEFDEGRTLAAIHRLRDVQA